MKYICGKFISPLSTGILCQIGVNARRKHDAVGWGWLFSCSFHGVSWTTLRGWNHVSSAGCADVL